RTQVGPVPDPRRTAGDRSRPLCRRQPPGAWIRAKFGSRPGAASPLASRPMPSHSPRPFSNPEHIIMRNGVGLVVAIASLIVPVASRALADVIITSETMTVDGKATQQTLYVTPERRKMDLGGMAVIVRTDTGKIVTLMKEKQEYIEMDPKQ